MRKMIIASTSTVYGGEYLEYLLPSLEELFKEVKRVLFIPYARPGGISYEAYTEVARKGLKKIGVEVKGIHEFEAPKKAIQEAEAIFTGGGNTFELVNQLYVNNILVDLKNVVKSGIPYLGTSAGSNICGVTMMNTNDMPIVYPPSFDTLGLIPFNINAHYLDPVENSTHMGETRETRIKEYHIFNNTSVLGLREGSWLEVMGSEIRLRGAFTARLFKVNSVPMELTSDSVLNFYKL
ncbi:dipeptidase PepE [Tenacibaculum maritimum]|uniref:dipeptidase PepE n=1 Tax=Tenacibaculum maritimum TaxID=107401 RepID=UPI0012E64C94|nr:dipeptidase PepE [Tenacibaculum maritimum]CAA0210667.1 Dipeptidase E [Tenacibaculum maritimum]CAA0224262.1 Dipeptidase E [Tenacibaculum maritimum]